MHLKFVNRNIRIKRSRTLSIKSRSEVQQKIYQNTNLQSRPRYLNLRSRAPEVEFESN